MEQSLICRDSELLRALPYYRQRSAAAELVKQRIPHRELLIRFSPSCNESVTIASYNQSCTFLSAGTAIRFERQGSQLSWRNNRVLRSLRVLLFLTFLAGMASAQTTLNAAGATFPYPIYSKWFSEYKKAHPEVEINYQSIGSGGGIRQVLAGTVDFGASDGPMTDEQLGQAKFKILHIPSVLGAVVPAYNVPGVEGEIKFTSEILSGIFLGKITNWNDQAIAAANPGAKFPDQSIIVVHRSDGSGTTYIFTDYLSKVSGEWQQAA